MSENTPRQDRRHRFLAKVGPHKQVSDKRIVDMPAQHGVAAYRDHRVTTACGQDVPTTLATRRDEAVRCPNCLAALLPENAEED